MIVRQQAEARVGEIVVALVGDDATVKRLGRDRDGWMLVAENPDYAPILIRPGNDFAILGKVIEVRRSLDDPPDP